MKINNRRIILCLDIDQTIMSHASGKNEIDINGSDDYGDASAWINALSEIKVICERASCELIVQIITAKAVFDRLTWHVFNALHPFLRPLNKQGQAILPFLDPTVGYGPSGIHLYYMLHRSMEKFLISTSTQYLSSIEEDNLLPPIHFCRNNLVLNNQSFNSKSRVMAYIAKHFDDMTPSCNMFLVDDQGEHVREGRDKGYQAILASRLFELEQGTKSERTMACRQLLTTLKAEIKNQVDSIQALGAYPQTYDPVSVQRRPLLIPHDIHLLVKEGHLTHVKALIADEPHLIDAVDAFNQTPLLWAVFESHVNIVAFLIEAGANINAATQLPDRGVYQENHNNTPFDWAIVTKNVDIINIFIQTEDALCNNHSDSDLLRIMIEANQPALIKYLVTRNPSLLRQCDNRGYSALHYAVICDQYEAICILIDHGVDLNLRSVVAKNRFPRSLYPNRTAIELACETQKNTLVILLFEAGASVVPMQERQRQVIHILAQSNRLDDVETLIKQNPAFADVEYEVGQPLLLWAASRGYSEVVKRLVQIGIDVNTKDFFGQTALILSVIRENVNLVKFLIKEGADVNAANIVPANHSAYRINHYTALDVAIKRGYLDIILLLEAENAQSNIHHTTINNITLKQLIGDNHMAFVRILLRYNATLRHQHDEDGYTPLHYAAIYGHVDLIDLLVEFNANINIRSASILERNEVHYSNMTAMEIWLVSHPLEPNPFNRYYREQILQEKKGQIIAIISRQLPTTCWPCCTTLRNEKMILNEGIKAINDTSFKPTDPFTKTADEVLTESLGAWAAQYSLKNQSKEHPYGIFSHKRSRQKLSEKVLRDIDYFLHGSALSYRAASIANLTPFINTLPISVEDVVLPTGVNKTHF